MKVWLSLAALASWCCSLATGAAAQDIPRIKARILSFDGKILSVTSGTAGQSLAIGLMPATRLMYEEKPMPPPSSPAIIWARPWPSDGGKWQAQEIHLLPQALQGAGEGLYPLPVRARPAHRHRRGHQE